MSAPPGDLGKTHPLGKEMTVIYVQSDSISFCYVCQSTFQYS